MRLIGEDKLLYGHGRAMPLTGICCGYSFDGCDEWLHVPHGTVICDPIPGQAVILPKEHGLLVPVRPLVSAGYGYVCMVHISQWYADNFPDRLMHELQAQTYK